MEKTKIIIDTDVGDDADDALAIALALRSPEIDILGITTVFKNVTKRAAIINRLLQLFKKEHIPIFHGVGTPIINPVNPDEIPCQYAVMKNEDNYKQKKHTHAVDFILRCVKENKELEIVAIGPLTNIAVAILKEPDVMKSAHIRIMGGAFGTTEREWNIFCDPEAAHIVMSSGADIKLIGLDVTTRCVLSERDLALIKDNKSPEVEFLNQLMTAWIKTSGFGITLHDPLVIGYLLKPSILTFQPRKVEIELNGNITRGSTIVKKSFFNSRSEKPNVEIATDVNETEMIKLFMECVANHND